MASSISNVCVCFSYDVGEEHGLPWTQNTWQGLRTGKPRRGEKCCSAPSRIYPDGSNSNFFPGISQAPQHRSYITKTQPWSQNSSPTQPHTDPNSTLFTFPQRESPHTLKHLKTAAKTREDGEISMQIFTVPAQLLPVQILLLNLLGILGCL